jgi:tol-pal system protein YbgF
MLKKAALFLGIALSLSSASAGLFEDDDARKAILDLRLQLEQQKAENTKARTAISTAASEENAALGRSVLDLQRQIELLKAELATGRGKNEELMRELAEVQRLQKTQTLTLEARIKAFEPVTVKHEGADFLAEPSEKREFEAAWAAFKQGDFATAQTLFVGFVSRFPSSGYASSALYWLGNAQYATRDYKEAIDNFHALITRSPNHPRVPEAALSVANCQIELKDSKAARKTLTDLIKAYPQSEAAAAAKERLSVLK